jgi:DNA-binding LacI/PurR family transcriptional regulator
MGGDGAKRPTIRTVAERAGVSKSLVSLVLNDSPKVSHAARTAVLEAIAELGYTPNAQARALSADRTRNVALIVADVRRDWHEGAVEEIATAVAGLGLRLFIADQHLDIPAGEVSTRAFTEMGVDGCLLLGPIQATAALAALSAAVPCVAFLGGGDGGDALAGDDAAGIGLAVAHLVGLGHRRIAHLAETGAPAGPARTAGYERAMAAAGLTSETLVAQAGNDEDSGFRAAVRLLSGERRPTGIVGGTDLIALGALSAARDLGLSVPGDCSITGYGNTALAQSRVIALTSIDPAPPGAGRRAATLLADRMRLPAAPARTERVAPVLAPRMTTGRVGPGGSESGPQPSACGV